LSRSAFLIAFALMTTGCGPALAQSAPPSGCGGGSSADLIGCIKQETAKWDKKLNAAYQEALKAAPQTQADQLRAAQRLWIQYRDADCLYYGLGQGSLAAIDAASCVRDLTRQRSEELEQQSPRTWKEGASGPAHFPRAAGSWGGVVRAGPGQEYPPAGDLKEGAKIVLLSKSAMRMNGFPWFRIRFHGLRQGYMWGGILCSVGVPSPDLYKTCP